MPIQQCGIILELVCGRGVERDSTRHATDRLNEIVHRGDPVAADRGASLRSTR